VVSWNDLPVTSAAPAGTKESYTAQIDGTSLLTVYAESDGAGGIQNYGVGVGSTTPSALFAVHPVSGKSAFYIGSTTVATFVVDKNGSVIVGNPTGGGKGFGTINAKGVYDDNTLLTDYVFDAYYDGSVRPEDADLHGDYRTLTLNEMEYYVQTNRHLPTITGRNEWHAQGGISLGKLATQLWETTETNSLYILELKNRLDAYQSLFDEFNITLTDVRTLDQSQNSIDPSTVVKGQVFTTTIIAKGGIVFNQDAAGVARILPGDDHVDVVFDKEYPYPPIVTATLLTDVNLDRYRIAHSSTKGFTITISPVYGDASIAFNWIVLATDNSQEFNSDGTYGGVEKVHGAWSDYTDYYDRVGCADPGAINYLATALEDDGGCVYPQEDSADAAIMLSDDMSIAPQAADDFAESGAAISTATNVPLDVPTESTVPLSPQDAEQATIAEAVPSVAGATDDEAPTNATESTGASTTGTTTPAS